MFLRYGKKAILLPVFLLCLNAGWLFPQDYKRGAILDEALYNSLPEKPVLATRAYTSLPQAVSLKPYAPFPGDQTDYGSCVAWASAYAARTISESIIVKRRDRVVTTENAYSPVFVYKNITEDPECQSGAAIAWALDLMKTPGAVKMLDMERSVDFKKVTLASFSASRKYPIADYVTLYKNTRTGTNRPSQVEMVKKSLSEGKPVIIGMNCPESFLAAGEVWRPRESPLRNYGGHAMCVIGYDDTKDGGSFEVMNSWGKKWGNGGFVWIPYGVFTQFVREAYEMIENLAAFSDTVQYAGSLRIELNGSTGRMPRFMPLEFSDGGYYRAAGSYPAGTEFRLLLRNDHPAYVYVFAVDSVSGAGAGVFPPPDVSPVLDYSENVIVLPGERRWIRIDESAGTDYLTVLFSKRPLDINAVMRRFEQGLTQGPGEPPSYPETAARAVGRDFISHGSAEYENGEIRFTAQSADAESVFGLLLAIEHQ
jgi:hypothetical protein